MGGVHRKSGPSVNGQICAASLDPSRPCPCPCPCPCPLSLSLGHGGLEHVVGREHDASTWSDASTAWSFDHIIELTAESLRRPIERRFHQGRYGRCAQEIWPVGERSDLRGQPRSLSPVPVPVPVPVPALPLTGARRARAPDRRSRDRPGSPAGLDPAQKIVRIAELVRARVVEALHLALGEAQAVGLQVLVELPEGARAEDHRAHRRLL